MAAATGQRFSNGSLNSHLHGHANGKYPGAAHHHHIMHGLVGGDATGGATEQFPPFDPLHDGSGEDVIANGNGYDDDDDDDYTHSSTRTRTQEAHAMNGNDNGSVSSEEEEQEQEGGKEEARSNALQKKHHSDGEMGEDEEDEQSHTPMSNLDPVPESDLHCHQQEVAAHQPQCRDDNASTTSEMTTTTTATVLSPVTSPPYWALAHTDALHPSSHPFNDHHINHSTESLIPGAITLQDNEADDDDDGQGDVNGHQNHNGEPQRQRTPEETRTSYGRDRNKACWAKSVEVTNYVIVNGSATNIGAFVVWNIRVQTLSVRLYFPPLVPRGKKKRDKLDAEREGVIVFADLEKKLTGSLHEHPETILRIRRLQAPFDTNLSQF